MCGGGRQLHQLGLDKRHAVEVVLQGSYLEAESPCLDIKGGDAGQESNPD